MADGVVGAKRRIVSAIHQLTDIPAAPEETGRIQAVG
jgi:hypothetical protein